MHEVAVLAMHGFVPFDLSIPCGVFGHVRLAGAKPGYHVRVCGEARKVRSRDFDLAAPARLDDLVCADTVIVPGIEDPAQPVSAPVLRALRTAWENGARIASICSGSFVLASAGLLDGRRATTHWIGAAELAQRFPQITVDPQVLFVDEGRIVTSAGASAGLDMCFHLVRKDYGQSIASDAARMAVSPLTRDGGQAQFIRHEPPTSRSSLAPLLEWMRENAHLPLDVDALAERACVSPRTFARRFREQTATTPLQWLLKTRIIRAQELLETTPLSIDQIAMMSGFETPVTFRARFRQVIGLSPSDYRRRFNGGCALASPGLHR